MAKSAKKKKEEEQIEHAIWGYGQDGKGVEIKAGSGIRDINPDPEKGVEIHDPRNG